MPAAASSEKGQNKQQAWDAEFPENDNIPCTLQTPNKPMLLSALLRLEEEEEDGETTTPGRLISDGVWAWCLVVLR